MIVVDPGHGGADPGCQTNGLVEKELTLRVALLVLKLARAIDVPLSLTRAADETLSLTARGHRAAIIGADQVVCLHFDTNTDPRIGRLTCYCDASDTQSRVLASRVIDVAPSALTQGSRVIFVDSNGWKRRACNVVRAYHAPALLVECCFISKPQHQAFLRTPTGLSALAVGLLCALTGRPVAFRRSTIGSQTYSNRTTRQIAFPPLSKVYKGDRNS